MTVIRIVVVTTIVKQESGDCPWVLVLVGLAHERLVKKREGETNRHGVSGVRQYQRIVYKPTNIGIRRYGVFFIGVSEKGKIALFLFQLVAMVWSRA